MCLGKEFVRFPRETHGGSKKPCCFPKCAFGGREIIFHWAMGPLGPSLNWPFSSLLNSARSESARAGARPHFVAPLSHLTQ